MDDNLVLRMVQVGVITAVDTAKRACRVKFPETGLTSDWLRVLRQPPTVAVADNNTDVSGPVISVVDWMPRINDTVVVLYIPVFNSDGFVIGVV